MNILFACSEAVPFTKTGGLADVAGALPRELARLGHRVCLVMPRYAMIDGRRHGLTERLRLKVPTFTGALDATVEEAALPDPTLPSDRRVRVLMIGYAPFFARAGLYMEGGNDYPDNLDRFAFFSRAVLELLPIVESTLGRGPLILHAHDWQTALSVTYAASLYASHSSVQRMRTLFTVHNVAYQGNFPRAEYVKTGLGPELAGPNALGRNGSICLLKGGLLHADYLSTVSPTYSRELLTPEYGYGLDGVVTQRRDRLVGILNGIDADTWDPATDPHLPARFTVTDLSGKRVCKAAVQEAFGLPTRNVPLLAVVSRLDRQKGIDLVVDCLPELVGDEVQVVFLGTGTPALESSLTSCAERYPANVGLRIDFDEGLAHRIIAGADVFLMPSRYEPCGLTEMYSMRYGTVPVVRRTGGLADTVLPYSPGGPDRPDATGFQFVEASPTALRDAVRLALGVYAKTGQWHRLVLAGMQRDLSWAASATRYVELYRDILETTGSRERRERRPDRDRGGCA